MTDGVHQVGLAESDVRVQDEGIVEFAGPAGDSRGRGVREFVGLSYDEALEGVPGVEGSGPVDGRLRRCMGDRDFAGLIARAVHGVKGGRLSVRGGDLEAYLDLGLHHALQRTRDEGVHTLF